MSACAGSTSSASQPPFENARVCANRIHEVTCLIATFGGCGDEYPLVLLWPSPSLLQCRIVEASHKIQWRSTSHMRHFITSVGLPELVQRLCWAQRSIGILSTLTGSVNLFGLSVNEHMSLSSSWLLTSSPNIPGRCLCKIVLTQIQSAPHTVCFFFLFHALSEFRLLDILLCCLCRGLLSPSPLHPLCSSPFVLNFSVSFILFLLPHVTCAFNSTCSMISIVPLAIIIILSPKRLV